MINKNKFFFEAVDLVNYSKLNCNDKVQFFKEFNVQGNIAVPPNDGSTEILHDCTATLIINESKVIDTIDGTSLEGQHLSSKKLLILGKVKFTVYFFIPYVCNYIFHKCKNVAFSEFIIIPSDTSDDSILKLRYIIEDVSSTLISKSRLFLNASIFIEYSDNS